MVGLFLVGWSGLYCPLLGSEQAQSILDLISLLLSHNNKVVYEAEVKIESKLSFLVRGLLDEVEFPFEGQLSNSGGLCCLPWCDT